MIMRQRSTAKALRCGAAAVEFAVLLPFLCFVFVVAVDYARVFYYTMVVTNCARNGAIYGSQNPTTANDQTGITSAAINDAPNLNGSLLNVSSSTDSSTSPTYVIVTVTYPFSTITNYPGVAQTTTISRSVRMVVTPLTPGQVTITPINEVTP